MRHRPSAERTRSRRWRSGTRRNKRNTTAHVMVCPQLGICLVHTSGYPDMILGRRPRAMAMKLTRCEQAWVDDVRAGRDHVHLRPFSRDTQPERRFRALRLIQRRSQLATVSRKSIGDDRHMSGQGGYHNSDIGVDYGHRPGYHSRQQAQVQAIDVNPGMTSATRAAMLPEINAMRHRLDISDRWYPRGE